MILFVSRLALYLLAVSLPLVHPAIAVSYDLPSLFLWYFLVPWEVILAYTDRPKWIASRYHTFFVLLPLIAVPFLTAGFGLQALSMLGIGVAAYLLTLGIFKYPYWGRRIAFLEQFFLGFIYLRLLNFSRSSEEAAGVSAASEGLPAQALMGLFLGAFFLHGLILYFTCYRGEDRRSGIEGLLFLGAAGILGAALFFLPPDFVKNTMVTNLLQNEVNPPPVPLDEEGDGFPNGNLRSPREGPERGFRYPGSRGRGGRRNRLEGIPQDEWPGTSGRSGKGDEGKQYAVMVVASREDPLYMANQYRGALHPVEGFIPLEGEPLNELSHLRLLETWRDREFLRDEKRVEIPFFALSTVGERYLPYKPATIEPTVFQRQYHPFLFQYRGSSRVSQSNLEEWKTLSELTAEERSRLAIYLEVPLAQNDIRVFQSYLSSIFTGKEGYFERILSILQSFSSFQYSLGYSEDTSIGALVDFLTFTHEGDCTEFSNTAALLARMAGIPSRVVTGYLASGDLQTSAHIRGLAMLRQALPPLQAFPLEDLFLVTTAHRHSWAQFWLPRYGWVDFETTSFAIPPLGFGDPNNRDVVIPLIREDFPLVPIPIFPWKTLLRFICILGVLCIAALYGFRYGRELWYTYRSRGSEISAARALYRLLLLRLAAEGYSKKSPSATPLEFSREFPEIPEMEAFASLYTELRYRTGFDPEELSARIEELRFLYKKILDQGRKKGVKGSLRRTFSLKGLGYVW